MLRVASGTRALRASYVVEDGGSISMRCMERLLASRLVTHRHSTPYSARDIGTNRHSQLLQCHLLLFFNLYKSGKIRVGVLVEQLSCYLPSVYSGLPYVAR